MRGLTYAWAACVLLATSNQAVAQSTSSGIDGNMYVAEVLKNIESRGSVSAKLRYESRLHGETLTGNGIYRQRGQLNKRLTRWEMHTQVADASTSYLQIFDGDYVWTERRTANQRHVTRLDVSRLKNELRASVRGTTLIDHQQLIASATGQEHVWSGGMSQMIAELLRNFNFQQPQPTQLNGLPVYSLIGTWRREQLERLWPDASKTPQAELSNWPEQLPHHVLLLIQAQNLFPAIVEHRRGNTAEYATSLAGLRPVSDPLLRYEIYDVNFTMVISPKEFDFTPDEKWTDETALVLRQVKATFE